MTPPVQYEYIWFAGAPVAQLTHSVPSEPRAATEVVYTVTDHLGTPRVQTDTTGAIVWYAEHEPYGEVYLMRAGAQRHQPLRFPGQEAEQLGAGVGPNGVSSRSYNIFRWYRAGAGRYTQADPIGLRGGVTLYSYGEDNPIFWFDPFGLTSGPIIPPSAPKGCSLKKWVLEDYGVIELYQTMLYVKVAEKHLGVGIAKPNAAGKQALKQGAMGPGKSHGNAGLSCACEYSPNYVKSYMNEYKSWTGVYSCDCGQDVDVSVWEWGATWNTYNGVLANPNAPKLVMHVPSAGGLCLCPGTYEKYLSSPQVKHSFDAYEGQH